MESKKYKIYSSKSEWILAFSVGILTLILYEYLNLDFYSFYIYFFMAGILSLISFFLGWGAILPEGLLIRFGVLRLRKIFFRWEDINNVSILYIKKKFFIRIGGGFAIPTKEDLKIKVIGIGMKKELTKRRRKILKKLSRNTIFSQQFEFENKRNVLYLYTEPPGGFEYIIQKINDLEKLEIAK